MIVSLDGLKFARRLRVVRNMETLGCDESCAHDVRCEAGKHRIQDVVREGIGVFAGSQAVGEADRSGPKHADPQDVERRGWIERLGKLLTFNTRANVRLSPQRELVEELKALK